MNKSVRFLGTLVSLALLLSACGGKPAEAPKTTEAPKPAAEAKKEAPAAPAAGDDLVAAAKKEGTVTVYAGAHTREQITDLAKRFEEKYGIKVVATRKATGEIMQMVEAERKAGAVQADVISVADAASLAKLRTDGMLEKFSPRGADRIEPAVAVKEGDAVPFYLLALGIVYNKDKVTGADIPKTWKDLTSDKFKGRIVHGNPDTSGTTAGFVNAVTKIAGWEVYEKIGTGGMLIQDSATGLVQLLVTGEALVALPGVEPNYIDALKKGEPVAIAYPTDGVPANVYYISAVKGAKHSAAAKLFVQFHIEEETQRYLSEKLASRPVIKGVAAPQGLPELSSLKLVEPDWVWLQANKRQQSQQFQGYLKKK